MHYISNILLKHARHIDQDPWRGLPELTNESELAVYRDPYKCDEVKTNGADDRRSVLLRFL
jgi:hypothetical protein